jgi:hypothetical protein
MNPSDKDIDEVALNVLLAEGVDLPTALEASRRSAGGGKATTRPGCLVVAALIAALLIALRLWM